MHPRRVVFTKPWKTQSIAEIADRMTELGADGIELPVRPGFQVEPETAEQSLAKAAEQMGERGLAIVSVAAEPDEPIVRACASAGVGLIRTMARIDMKTGYRASVDALRTRLEALVPLLRKSGVRVGVQNHCDYFVGSALGLIELIEPLDPEAVCAVLDLAHCSLDGEPIDMAIDICRERMGLVNMKSACRRRINGANASEAKWKIDWTTARDSLYSWRSAVESLENGGYGGDICLTAEYSNPTGDGDLSGDEVLPLLAYDLAYLDSLID